MPWFVNATLSESQTQMVTDHLRVCASCRADAAELGQLRLQLRAPAQVEHAPHAGWQKLLAHIDGAERDANPIPAVARPRPRGGLLQGWLPAAVVMQALALAAIGAVLLLRPAAAPTPDFRTLSTAQTEPAALRVVFAPATTLGELQALLQANQLSVLAGPTDAGIFTLALRSADRKLSREEALARLRADPRVRFAEPVGTAAELRP
jgi:hypothetical protein